VVVLVVLVVLVLVVAGKFKAEEFETTPSMFGQQMLVLQM